MPTLVKASVKGKKKSAADYERELEEKKSSYQRDGVDLSDLEAAFKKNKNAASFLSRNRADHPAYDEKKRQQESSKELAAKHKSLLVIERNIRKRRSEEQQAAANELNDEPAPEPAPVGSTESTARVFLILYQLFCVLAKVSPSENAVESLDAQEIDALDNAISAHLHQRFQQSSRLEHLLPALKKLEELGVINLAEEDGNVQVQCVNNALVQFSLIDAAIRGGARRTKNELFHQICDASESQAREFLTRARELELLAATRVKRDWELDCGPCFDEFGNFAMPLFDWIIKWRILDRFNEQEDDSVLLSHVVDDMYSRNKANFGHVLRIFRSLSILDIDQNGVSRGPAMSIDNEKWLSGDDQQPQQRTQSRSRSATAPANASASQRTAQRTASQPNGRQPPTTRQQTTQSSQSLPDQRRQCPRQCANCKRQEFAGAEAPYVLQFHTVPSRSIRVRGTFKHVKAYTGANACNYQLCHECFQYLVEKDDASAWPAFFWRLLSGFHKNMFGQEYHFFSTYGGDTLWRFIPKTMRPWWLPAVQALDGLSGEPHPYRQCTLDEPAPLFVDKTLDMRCFDEDYNSGQLARVVNAMCNHKVVDSNVLCPFNCATSCRNSGRIPLDLMVQRMLPKVILPMFSDPKKYRLVHWSSNQYFMEGWDYPDMLLNNEWLVGPGVILDCGGLRVITCPFHDGGQDKMTLYPPRSPTGHIFNAEQADQLAACVQIPRITKSVKPMKYCTKFGMVQCRSGYPGTSTADLSAHSDFSKTSLLLSDHEAASIVGRSDMQMVLERKVANGEITAEMANEFVSNARERFTIEDIRRNTQGATYVAFDDMIRIQLFETSTTKQVCIINDDRRLRRPKEMWVRRSWPILINLTMTEDSNGYGTQFRPIPKFRTVDVPSALAWSLFAMLSSCKELWHVIDTKPTPFRKSGWEAWVMTAIPKFCFEFDSISVDKRSPIKKLTSLAAIATKVNAFAPPELDDPEQSDAHSFYKFNIHCFYRLFHPRDYSSSLVVIPTMEDAVVPEHAQEYASKKIIIVVGSDAPAEGRYTIGGAVFELKVICLLRAKEKGQRPSHHDAVRYMRHGRGFSSWWKQERKDAIATQCLAGEELYDDLHYATEDCYFAQFVCVYARCDDVCVDQWRTKFFESMGGKSHVRCQCRQFPLIPSHRPRGRKLKCNMSHYRSADGVEHLNQHNCQRNESYVCSNVACNLRLCSTCYNALPADSVTTLIPPDDQDADESDNAQSGSDDAAHGAADSIFDLVRAFQEDEANDASNENGDDDESHLEYRSDGSDDGSASDNFLVSSAQDATLDLTSDNVAFDQGFLTTNAGDAPVNVEQDPSSKNRVAGHVLFNQAGKCTTRHNQTITGTSRERHLVQSLCATTPGQVSPLIQPEASIFPRHFPASAEHDECSILGAQPLFLLSSKATAYGFASTLTQARIHITNPYSTTSTDPNLMCMYFDLLGNMVLNSCHSRDVFERGFVVDNSSAYGMSVRDKDHTKLAGSVDSRKMVLNLAASQKYVKYTWFLTFTANQKEHPGLAHLHEWKNSNEWTKSIPGYESLPAHEQAELKKAMEQAYGVHVYSNWNAVKYMLLRHIKEHCSVLGTTLAIFARDEYQGDAGNLCHNHLILAIDKSTMTGDTERYIQDLIRTSVLEVVRTDDDVPRLIQNGLLRPEGVADQVAEHSNRAGNVLGHICDERCKRRVKVTDGGPGDFRCRKMHSVRDCPDPTRHNYIAIPYKYQPSTLEVLEEVGMYKPPEEAAEDQQDSDAGDDGEANEDEAADVGYIASTGGTFTHSYFVPKRHIAPVNVNDDSNMSPVICDFFVALKSMQNAQALDHTNGVAKYVCKYITKFDDGNYVVLCQDIHTGQWVLGKTHLHNTKIVSSKINEDKAMAKERTKNHPKGRDVAHFEIRQIIMGDPEVFTNLEWVSVSTLPFELRPTNSIKLDSFGNVVGESQEEDEEEHPDDAFTSGAPMQRLRQLCYLPEHQLMTGSQLATFRNHNGKASKYDTISLFSLRPPELLGVFRNPADYYRYCHIEAKPMKEADVEAALDKDMYYCSWIDCLGRRVRIRELALEEVSQLIEDNLTELQEIDSPTGADQFAFEVNEAISEMIAVHQTPESELNMSDLLWAREVEAKFFYHGGEELLPVPVLSSPSPANAQQFLTHIILSLGKYSTEMDALTHPTIRDSLRAVGLIGSENDEESLRRYSARLARRHYEEQLVHYPNSLKSAEKFIVLSKRVFDDAIIHNALSMNELPPITMTGLRAVQTEANERWWASYTESQLQSIYTTLQHATGLPPREQVLQATREAPVQWTPVDTMTQYEHQSEASFEEQRAAIEWNVRQINKYRATDGRDSLTYTKNIVVFGAPGTGKSFVGQYSVLYALSQKLNIMSTSLMGVRANALGGLHLHKLFLFPVNAGSSASPFKLAELAMQKIMRQTTLLHALLTLDAIFLDEASQTSSQQLAAMDIILRKKRHSQIPFGGVLILGTMDPSQLGPIDQLPFLTSSLMLTCFMTYELKHSVRAHGDPDFERLQAITRMNPFVLLASSELKAEFFQLAKRLRYVSDWNDNRIGPNMMRAFSRVRPTQEALNETRESIKRQLTDEGVPFRLATSRDTQRTRGTNGEWIPASEQSIKSLDKELKEPAELVFCVGGIYECTINDTRDGQYCQSQLAFMMDLPSQDDVERFNAIAMWIAPAGSHLIEYDRHRMPTKEQLLAANWKEVRIGVSPDQLVEARYGIQAQRLQYSLKHIGAITINKAQGATLPLGIAIEMTEEYSPWLKGQIVVGLSRSTTANMTVIVGNRDFAIKKMWELITQYDQWTRYVEHVLDIISVNREENAQNQNIFDYPEVYPFRLCDITLPTDQTGFIYCLVSKRHMNRIYVGQTKCLAQRVPKHNEGTGAEDTADIRYRPWGVAAYICGLSHMTTSERMSLERRWKRLVEGMIRHGQDDSFSWINAGARIIEEYNSGDVEEHIRFVRCISAEVANGGWHPPLVHPNSS